MHDLFYTVLNDNPILKVCLGGSDKQQIIEEYNQPHRFYHNLDHIERVLKLIGESNVDYEMKNLLNVVAIFHDIHYLPLSPNNEEKSAEIVFEYLKNLDDKKTLELIIQIIKETAQGIHTTSGGSTVFKMIDFSSFFDVNFSSLLENEQGIFKEYQTHSVKSYRTGRVKVLKNMPTYGESTNLDNLIDYVKGKKYNIGVYAGSFSPYFHVGHMSVLEKAEAMFDKVIVAQGINPDKSNPLQDISRLKNTLPFHQIDSFTGLLPTYVEKLEEENCNVTIVKGLRNGYDLEYESNQLRAMQDIKPDIKVIYIYTDPSVQHVSGTLIRGLLKFDNNNVNIKRYIPQKYNYRFKG